MLDKNTDGLEVVYNYKVTSRIEFIQTIKISIKKEIFISDTIFVNENTIVNFYSH